MNKRIETVRILNNCLMIFVVFVTFMSGIGMPVGSAALLSGAVLVFFVLLSELIQAFVSNLVLFLISHIAAGAVSELLLRMVYKATDLKVTIAGVLMANIAMVIAAVFLIAVTVAAKLHDLVAMLLDQGVEDGLLGLHLHLAGQLAHLPL